MGGFLNERPVNGETGAEYSTAEVDIEPELVEPEDIFFDLSVNK